MTTLIFLAALAAIGIVLAGLAAVYEWRPIDDIKAIWRFWTVRIQAVSAMLTGWMFFDPSAMLYAFNLLPGHVRAALPESVAQAVSIVGGIVFFLNVLAIMARGVAQPKTRK